MIALIKILGCDDTTRFTMEVTEVEFQLLQKVQAISEATSTYGCMPTLEVERVIEKKNELL